MSIIITAAATAGMAVHNYVFNHSKKQYVAKISEIEGLKSQLEAHHTKLIELREQIPYFWDDDNAKATAEALQLTIEKVNHHMHTADMILRTLNQTVTEFDLSQGEIKGLIEDAFASLSSIGDK